MYKYKRGRSGHTYCLVSKRHPFCIAFKKTPIASLVLRRRSQRVTAARHAGLPGQVAARGTCRTGPHIPSQNATHTDQHLQVFTSCWGITAASAACHSFRSSSPRRWKSFRVRADTQEITGGNAARVLWKNRGFWIASAPLTSSCHVVIYQN